MSINIFFWSPCLSKVGTYKSTINSAISLSKYSKNKLNIKVINACGEWNFLKKKFKENKVDVVDLGFNYFRFLPKEGFFQSRISYLIIIILSFIPLIRLIAKYKPDFLVVHLLTSLPIFLKFFFKIKSKLILRISGYPKMNIFRKLFWLITSSCIYKVFCPSNDLLKQLYSQKIFPLSKLVFVPDPILNTENLIYKKHLIIDKFKDITKNDFYISVGRLTKQKNFLYLIDEFYEYLKNGDKTNLLIFGEGEEKINLEKRIKKYNLKDKIFLMGYSENIYYYMKKAKALLLSSLWEDPGFVIIEAAMNNLFVISSNCKNGPEEFLDFGKRGILYQSNKKNALKNALKKFTALTLNEKKLITISAKKSCMPYSLYRHYNRFKSNL